LASKASKHPTSYKIHAPVANHPYRSYHSSSALSRCGNVCRDAFAKLVRFTIDHLGGRAIPKQLIAQPRGISLHYAKCSGENTRLVPSTRVGRTEAIIFELSDVDIERAGFRQFHRRSLSGEIR